MTAFTTLLLTAMAVWLCAANPGGKKHSGHGHQQNQPHPYTKSPHPTHPSHPNQPHQPNQPPHTPHPPDPNHPPHPNHPTHQPDPNHPTHPPQTPHPAHTSGSVTAQPQPAVAVISQRYTVFIPDSPSDRSQGLDEDSYKTEVTTVRQSGKVAHTVKYGDGACQTRFLSTNYSDSSDNHNLDYLDQNMGLVMLSRYPNVCHIRTLQGREDLCFRHRSGTWNQRARTAVVYVPGSQALLTDLPPILQGACINSRLVWLQAQEPGSGNDAWHRYRGGRHEVCGRMERRAGVQCESLKTCRRCCPGPPHRHCGYCCVDVETCDHHTLSICRWWTRVYSG